MNVKIAAILVSLTSFSSMGLSLNLDGCFQLYRPGSLFPVVCVDGAHEEGIGGSGARVSIIGPNSLEVHSCSITASIRINEDITKNKTVYVFEDGETIKFNGTVNSSTNSEEGTIKIGNSEFNYTRLSQADAQPILEAVDESGLCKR
jgi:hypothetical protein